MVKEARSIVKVPSLSSVTYSLFFNRRVYIFILYLKPNPGFREQLQMWYHMGFSLEGDTDCHDLYKFKRMAVCKFIALSRNKYIYSH